MGSETVSRGGEPDDQRGEGDGIQQVGARRPPHQARLQGDFFCHAIDNHILFQPADAWPEEGRVEFSEIELRYAPEEKDVLRNLAFKTEPREKVGIVGRTGAGKSSLVAALFRLAEPRGKILIDGVDVLKIGLKDLRAKISIIPQDPLVFTGTLRRNLDPFSEHDDASLWRVLEEVHLAEAVRDLKEGLATEMSEGGGEFEFLLFFLLFMFS